MMTDLRKYFVHQRNIRRRDRFPVRVMRFQRSPHLYNLFQELGFTKGVEIGVRWGKNARDICAAIPSLELTAVDPWCDYAGIDKIHPEEKHNRLLKKARVTLAPYNVVFMRMISMDAVARFPFGSLDFVYIDGNHNFDFVMEDLINWSRRVRPGGIVSGHDYCYYRSQQVIEAVDAYTQAHEIKEMFITDEQAPTYFWRKT